MKKCKLIGKILELTLVCLIIASIFGNLPVAAQPAYTVVTDPSGDVGLPGNAPGGTLSGWDITALSLAYNAATDTMSVGINVLAILGDADGDGNPGGSAAWLVGNGGSDIANLGSSETVAVCFDLDQDGTYDVIAGIGSGMDYSDFSVNVFTGAFFPPINFGAALPANTGDISPNPSATYPDLEFTIVNWSTLPGHDGSPGFCVGAYLGSLEDDGIGEDFLTATVPYITPFTVSSVSPSNGATGVSLDTVLTATFSEALNESTINEASFVLDGGAVAGIVTYEPTTYTATFTPDANLELTHTYTASLTTDITDLDGNPLTEAYTWSFTTEPLLYYLTISNTAGGSVTSPGEGVFTCGAGTVVSLIASPSTGYWFMNWTGDVATIDNVDAAATTVTMNDNYSITANFQLIPPPLQYDPSLTGDVEVDFAGPGVVIIPDPIGDVGFPSGAPEGTISGWDMVDLRLAYQASTDTLYVGINTFGIAGDADGNGDPGGSAAWLTGKGGSDIANLGDSETVAVYFDLDQDGTYDVIAGIGSGMDYSDFSVNVFTGAFFPPINFGAVLPDNIGSISPNPDSAHLDLEFTVTNWTALPGHDGALGFFDVGVFTGSLQDDGIGEDFLTATVGVAYTTSSSQSVETATGTGTTYFTSSNGSIEDLQAVPAPAPPPHGVHLPHGMFTFEITGLTPGQSVTLTVEFPDPIPTHWVWWKYHNNTWSQVPITRTTDPRIITFTLTDGVYPGDEDDIPGQITDQGGPGSPGSVGWEAYSANKVRVMLPWIALIAAIITGMSIPMLRRRYS